MNSDLHFEKPVAVHLSDSTARSLSKVSQYLEFSATAWVLDEMGLCSWMVNGQGFERRRSRPISNYCPAIQFSVRILARTLVNLIEGFSWFSSVPPGKYKRGILISIWPLPSKSFPVCHHSCIITQHLLLILKVSLNKLKWNKSTGEIAENHEEGSQNN